MTGFGVQHPGFGVQLPPDSAFKIPRITQLEQDGRPARTVALSRSYSTTVEDLWNAVTNGERIPRWFLPISGELEPGGRYQLDGNAGGVITACERPSRLTLTWEFGGDVSWVEVGLAVDGPGHARLTLTHTAHLSEHWGEYGPGAAGVRAKAGGSRFRPFAGRQGIHHRQQRCVGASGGRGRHGPRRRACRGRAHNRVLHGRIRGACLMHAFDVLRYRANRWRPTNRLE